MSRRIALRLALPVLLATSLLPAATLPQSQNSQSVAEAARRARAQKRNSDKPAKVITDETLDVKKGDVQSAAAEQLKMPGSSETQAQPAPGAANARAVPAAASASAPSSATQAPKKASEDEKLAKEIADLKEQVKQAESDLDLLQREQVLERDNYYSNPDYVHNTAGKAKWDAVKQQASDKQEELVRLKARLAELQASHGSSSTMPPKP